MKSFKLNRRTFLRGAGYTLALPTLDAMLDSRGFLHGVAHAQGKSPVRLVIFHFPHGVVPAVWTPSTTGKSFTFTPTMKPLEPHRDKLNIISGLEGTPAKMGNIGGAHSRGLNALATGMSAIQSGAGGPSMDQVLGSELGGATRFRAVVACNEQPGNADDKATTAHANNMSWSAAGRFVPAERNPAELFKKLFSGGVPMPPPGGPPPADTTAAQRSILDHVKGDVTALSSRLGSGDRARLDDYLTGLRELERQLDSSSMPLPTSCTPGSSPTSSLSRDQRARAFIKIFVTAMQCDLTRYVSFALSNAFDNTVYSDLGMNQHHHEISHRGSDADLNKHITHYHGLLAYMLDLMKAVPETGGTNMIDNSIVYFTSEMMQGVHSFERIPVVLAGRAGGRIQTGQHLTFPAGTSICRLLFTIMQAAGSKVTKFGMNGDAVLNGILV